MDIEKLIEQYRQAADKWEKRHPITGTFDLRVQDALREAATALSTLQAENEKLRAELARVTEELNDLRAQWDMYGGDDGITATYAELERVKAEMDAAVECIETVYAKILIKCKTDAVRAIEKRKKQRED